MTADNAMLATLDVLERLHRLPDTVALTTAETAVFLRSSVSALEAMRRDGSGPTYIQGGSRGTTGANQKCLYQKRDLLAWQDSQKVISSVQAAMRKGQLFVSLQDLAREEAFWMDEKDRVAGLVELTPMAVVIERLGILEVVWMPVIDAVSREWNDLNEHSGVAEQISVVLRHQLGRVGAGVQSTDVGNAITK
jgi:hypothetical protein